MILILLGIIVTGLIGFTLIWSGNSGYEARHMVAYLLGILTCAAAVLVAIFYVIAGWNWIAADSKAKIINREYGTHYTREEVFYASDVIDTIREIDRKRVEVNGDLMSEKRKATKP